MPGVRGNNVFHGAFDFFEWSAKYYTTPLEVTKALERSLIVLRTAFRILNIKPASLRLDGDPEKRAGEPAQGRRDFDELLLLLFPNNGDNKSNRIIPSLERSRCRLRFCVSKTKSSGY